MKTLKLFTSDGRALTTLTSADETLSLPNEIQIDDNGTATACHAESGDNSYPTLAELCDAYRIDEAEVLRELEPSA